MTPAFPSPYVSEIPAVGTQIRITVLRDGTTNETMEKYGCEAAGDLEAFRLRRGQRFIGVVQEADAYGFLLAIGGRLQAFAILDPIAIALLSSTALALAA